MSHNLMGMHVYEKDENHIFFILGHAYNPFTMEYEEGRILAYIADAYGTGKYLDRINELTGVFVYGAIIDKKIYFQTDPSGMQSACYGMVEGCFYLSSHAQLISDLCDLEMDDFVKEMISYRWYGRVMGAYLPADLTPFAEVKRVVPDICYSYRECIKHKRFWPTKECSIAESDDEYSKVIWDAADILKKNMELVSRKWNNPWISLTGGIDSNTTFAAGNGNYDKFETFSYISAEKEVPDAEAARKLQAALG